MEAWTTLAAERHALADTLAALSPAQWSAPSLCPGWSVHDVAVHYELSLEGGAGALVRAAVRARGNLDRANELLVADRADVPAAEVVSTLRRCAGSRATPPFQGWHAPLAELMLHGADVRVPLGLGPERPVAVWAEVLGFLVSGAARRGFVSGRLPALSYVALDADWTHQVGFGTRQVVGPARDLALVLSGRPAGLTELHGPGLETLASWLPT